MKNIPLLFVVAIAACGQSSSDNEVVGQVKKVVNKTPIACPNYAEVDASCATPSPVPVEQPK